MGHHAQSYKVSKRRKRELRCPLFSSLSLFLFLSLSLFLSSLFSIFIPQNHFERDLSGPNNRAKEGGPNEAEKKLVKALFCQPRKT